LSEGGSSKLTYTEPASMVNPVVPETNTPETTEPPVEKKSDGVEGFIDEFKKEMELLKSNELESVVLRNDDPPSGKPDQKLAWEDKLETLTSKEVGLFTNKFATELAERIAVKIAAKINSEKLLRLIRDEIINRAQKHS